MDKVLVTLTAFLVPLGVSVAAPPLQAHEGHLDFEWFAPAEGLDVSGRSGVEARASFPEGLDRWTLELLPLEGSPGEPQKVCGGRGEQHGATYIECEWDTTAASDGSIAPNGTRLLRVTAWERTEPGAEPEPHVAPTRPVVVANPPLPPEGVRLTWSEASSEVTLTWKANDEPDIARYVVEERFEDEDWTPVAEPTTSPWTGRVGRPGVHEFRVSAIRPVGSGDRFLTGRPSSTDPRSLEVDTPPETTTSSATAPAPASPGEPGQPPPAPVDKAGPPGSPEASPLPGTAPPPDAPPPGELDVQYQLGPQLESRPGVPGPPATAAEPDTGFSETLPYERVPGQPSSPPGAPGDDALDGLAFAPQRDERPAPSLAFPAIALLLFVGAMLGVLVARRPHAGTAGSGDWD